MKPELLPAYRDLIMRCIDTSVHPDHLVVCHDMIQHFEKTFKPVVWPKALSFAMSDLLGKYVTKQDQLKIN